MHAQIFELLDSILVEIFDQLFAKQNQEFFVKFVFESFVVDKEVLSFDSLGVSEDPSLFGGDTVDLAVESLLWFVNEFVTLHLKLFDTWFVYLNKFVLFLWHVVVLGQD